MRRCFCCRVEEFSLSSLGGFLLSGGVCVISGRRGRVDRDKFQESFQLGIEDEVKECGSQVGV